MVQILKYEDIYHSMMKMNAEVEFNTAEPELAQTKKYRSFCGKKVKRYKHVSTLSKQIDVQQLQALLARYMNLDKNVVNYCRI